ncbi:MAG: GNAT family N-acetyltransferase [Spirochaetales bacterium]|nr:GNAT family N-acetyltransferase [Spirochaetales bacterium]
MEIRIETLKKEELDKIAPLWEKLNQIHLNDSQYWKERFETMTFNKRAESLYSMNEENLHCQVLTDGSNLYGYCLTSIQENRKKGGIESLFIDKELRGENWGTSLVEKAISWLKEQKAERIFVSVSEGHERVFPFYRKLGFAPKMTNLELKD